MGPDGYLSEEEGLGEFCSPCVGVSGVSTSFNKKPFYSNSLYSDATIREFPINPIGRTFPISETTLKDEASKSTTVSKLLRPVSEESLPDLINLLHNSQDGVLKIVTCFKTKHPEVSKRQIEIKMKELATKVSGRWQLKDDELRQKYCPNVQEEKPLGQEGKLTIPVQIVEARVLIPKIEPKNFCNLDTKK